MRASPVFRVTATPMPRIVIADDHLLVAEGISRILDTRYTVAGIVRNGLDLVTTVVRDRPDAVVCDVSMPGLTGLQALSRLRALGEAVPFVVASMHAEPAVVREAMRVGASAYVLKEEAGEDLLLALEAALAGRRYVSASLAADIAMPECSATRSMTSRQRQILSYASQGLRSKQIASLLGISARTVEAHKYALMQMFDAHTTLQMVRRAEELGVLSSESECA